MSIDKDLLDQLMDGRPAGDLFGKAGVLAELTKALAERALNSKIRRAVRSRGHFPSDEAAAKLIYLALNASSVEWKRSVREWHALKSQFVIMFEDRFPMT